jgi:hypothetical protein
MGTAYRSYKIEQRRLMFDACILQDFNNDVRDQLAHCIQTLP